MAAINTKPNVEVLFSRLFDQIHIVGEKANKDLPNTLEVLSKAQGYREILRGDGTPMESLYELLMTGYPQLAEVQGLAMTPHWPHQTRILSDLETAATAGTFSKLCDSYFVSRRNA